MKNLVKTVALFALLTLAAPLALAVPAYEGGSFAWTYPAAAPNLSGFKLTIDGVAGSTTVGKDIREIKFDATGLKGKPFATYTVKLTATAAPPAVDSVAVPIVVEYQARPQLVPPTGFKVIFEWTP